VLGKADIRKARIESEQVSASSVRDLLSLPGLAPQPKLILRLCSGAAMSFDRDSTGFAKHCRQATRGHQSRVFWTDVSGLGHDYEGLR
jgi:hypothetical protein